MNDEYTPENFRRVFFEIMDKYSGPLDWMEKEGLPVRAIEEVNSILDQSLIELTTKDDMDSVAAHTMLQTIAFMLGWELHKGLHDE